MSKFSKFISAVFLSLFLICGSFSIIHAGNYPSKDVSPSRLEPEHLALVLFYIPHSPKDLNLEVLHNFERVSKNTSASMKKVEKFDIIPYGEMPISEPIHAKDYETLIRKLVKIYPNLQTIVCSREQLVHFGYFGNLIHVLQENGIQNIEVRDSQMELSFSKQLVRNLERCASSNLSGITIVSHEKGIWFLEYPVATVQFFKDILNYLKDSNVSVEGCAYCYFQGVKMTFLTDINRFFPNLQIFEFNENNIEFLENSIKQSFKNKKNRPFCLIALKYTRAFK